MPICQNASNLVCIEKCSQGSKHFLRTRLRNFVRSGIALILQKGKKIWLFGNIKKYAKAYIKKNSKRFIKRLLDEGDEERAVDFLKTGFVSKVTLKTLLPIAKEKEQTTVQSYILEQMNSKGIAKENLYL